MAIKLRTVKGSELTYQEADENFSSLFYSASIDGTTISLYYTGSAFAPGVNPVNIEIPTGGSSKWTGSLGGDISRLGNVDIVGAVTGSTLKIPSTPVGTTESRILVTDTSGNVKYRTNLQLQGVQGVQGPMGPQGATGIQGDLGIQGSTGSGAQGTQGVQGITGIQGDLGIQGSTGSGAQGTQGSQGATGTQGALGIQGSLGNTGAQGTTGSTGIQGNTGIQGLTGTQGATGASIQGTTGQIGAQGIQGITGSQGATGTQGSTGTGIQGTAGTNGTNGTNGSQGTTGSQGAAGTNGSNGAQGATGTQGSTGASIQGLQGYAGANGSQGTTGTTGATGSQGTTGTTGSTGSQGATGATGPTYSLQSTSTGDWYVLLGDSGLGGQTYPYFDASSTGFKFNAGTHTLTVQGNVTAAGFFNSSDRRLKSITRRDGDVAYYTWLDGRDDKEHIGYIAQEQQQTYPDQVGSDGEFLTVNYTEILVAKVRQLEKEIELLKAR